jgi:methylenetetrahydrofolate dehydrogenase (NADP+)/methenyltetrahydrofolate cyclohydrolase
MSSALTATGPIILDGKATAEAVRAELASQVEALRAHHIVPGLAAVLVGDDPASHIYVRSKAKACGKAGIHSEVLRLAAQTSEHELLALVEELNHRADIHGILVQSPLPKEIDEFKINLTVSPEKDVDGFHPANVGRLLLGHPGFAPCTPAGVLEMLRRYRIDPAGKHVVIAGRGNIVGKPLAAMLIQKAAGANATVTVCHSRTADLAAECRRADILIAAMGQPELITGDMVKEGAVVIDVGINRVDDAKAEKGYRVVGDVHFDSVAPKCRAITPVPGGVGPMTIAMLLKNTVVSAQRLHSSA